jgi:hypothetical protein
MPCLRTFPKEHGLRSGNVGLVDFGALSRLAAVRRSGDLVMAGKLCGWTDDEG